MLCSPQMNCVGLEADMSENGISKPAQTKQESQVYAFIPLEGSQEI